MIRLFRQMHSKYIKLLLLLMLFSIGNRAHAQEAGPLIDKIAAKVDNHIILLSDIEFTYLDLAARGALAGDDPKCRRVFSRSIMGNRRCFEVDPPTATRSPFFQRCASMDRRPRHSDPHSISSPRTERSPRLPNS